MSLDYIKNALHQSIEVLFANIAIDELTGDTESHRKKLCAVLMLAKLLGVDAKIITRTYHIEPIAESSSD